MPASRRPALRPPTVGLEELHRRKARLAELCEAFPETIAVNRYDNEHLSMEVVHTGTEGTSMVKGMDGEGRARGVAMMERKRIKEAFRNIFC